MKIGIDIRCLAEGRRTGIEEYTLNLLHHLFLSDQKNEYFLFYNSFGKSGLATEEFEKYPQVTLKKWKLPNKILNFCFWYFHWPKIDKILGGVDVFFMPNINFAAWSRSTKAILTMHDLSFERFPETFSLKRRLWHFFINPRRMCRRVSKIITVSCSTRQDLRDLYKIEEKKIKLIYSGVSEKFTLLSRNDQRLFEIQKKYGLPAKFILYLGTIEPRKNIAGIIQAFEGLGKSTNPEIQKYKLVIAGSPGWKEKEIFRRWAESPRHQDIFFPGFITEEDKPFIYNLASVFVYPSFFEGFGFPPLEAMRCGLPVVVSNNSSLPEVVGQAGIMVDADRPEEMEKALLEILADNKLKNLLIQKSLERAKKFRWSKTVRNLKELFEEK